jgi:hypothetical protein
MPLLSKGQILAAQDMQFEDVDVPEWGGTVRVGSMSAAERDTYEQSLVSAMGPDRQLNMRNARARLLAWCIVDEGGARVFEEADIEALGAKSAATVGRLFDVAARLNGIGRKDVEELTKN